MNNLNTICLEFSVTDHVNGTFRSYSNKDITEAKETVVSDVLEKFDSFINVNLTNLQANSFKTRLKQQTIELLINEYKVNS